eukprot:8174545-Heterocapsa_arctica.AAC.1
MRRSASDAARHGQHMPSERKRRKVQEAAVVKALRNIASESECSGNRAHSWKLVQSDMPHKSRSLAASPRMQHPKYCSTRTMGLTKGFSKSMRGQHCQCAGLERFAWLRLDKNHP